MPMTRMGHMFLLLSSAKEIFRPSSFFRVTIIFSTSVLAYVVPPIFSNTLLAASALPILAKNLGLLGTINISRKNNPAGTISAQNIHLQPVWPFHEDKISDEPKSVGIVSAIKKLAI